MRRERTHHSGVLIVAAVAAAALLVLLVVDGTRWVELRVTDSVYLVRGSHAASYCIDHGIWSDCKMPTGATPDTVGAWPILQYLLAIPLVAAGVADFSVLTVMAVVSSLAAGGVLLLIAFPIRRLFGTEWSVVLAVGMLTSPFLLYALLPLGEALGAFLALAFVVAACARRPGWLLVTGFFAGMTKETVAPLLLVLAIVCAREARDWWLPAGRLLVPIVAGLGAAVVVNSAFNIFRFGSIRNLEYTQPHTRVPGIALPVRLALADWFAPNVGVVWFWSVAGLMVAGLVISTVVLIVRHPRAPAEWLPALAVVGVITAFTGGLSLWYSTFGWVA